MSSSDGGLDPSTARLLSIGMAFLAGVLVGGVVLTAFPLGGPAETGPDPDNVPQTASFAGPSCVEDTVEVNPNGGWVHEVAAGTSYAVTLNATVVHDAGTELNVRVARVGETDTYALTVDAVDGESPPDECETVRTRLEVGASLPTSYERLEIRAGGETLVDAERDDTTADLYPLPNPINVTSRG
jgi:hypothetical protein